jgi:DIS3-like exonuclease 2
MEGDIVAVMIEPKSAWSRMKGSFNKQASPEPATVGDGGYSVTEGDTNIEAVSVSKVENEHTESIPEDVKDIVVRVEGKTTETRYRTFMSKDSNRKLLPMQEDSQLLKSKSGTHNNGRLVDQKTTVSRNKVYQILKRPTSENASVPVALQSSMEKLTLTTETSKGSSATVTERSVETVCDNLKSGVDSNGKIAAAIASLTSLISSCPGKRPTAKVVAIVQNSVRRESVVGFLEMPQQRGGSRPGGRGFREDSPQKRKNVVTMLLMPVDSRCPKMLVPPSGLPPDLYERLKEGDSTVATELVAAKVDTWRVDSHLPSATVVKSLGQGGEIEPQLKAILFENNAHPPDFPQESLDCLPKTPWKIPASEMKKRVDLRRCRIFSIDPPTARDLDDALSIEKLRNGVVRIGVHIADVSYFISPGSALDKEAAHRSTSIYLEQRVLPMLPRLLCEELCSLNPGVDRLAFSVVWDISTSGQILDQWIGRTVINSCAKLTYEHAQDMIEGAFMDMEGAEARQGISKSGNPLPQIHGNHSWLDIVTDVLGLHEMAKKRRDSRVEGGALKLNNSKIIFSLDEDGTPYETSMYKTKDSNFVVEEFMLLANMTVAKVISNAFPESALLRRHPEPNMRKLKEFEEFCGKNEFDLDTSSSGALRLSLEKMQDRVSHDPVLYNILMVFATKPMQLAKYFCTGELKDKEEDWGHYALACPLYTHFTSPIRRYPDVLVHRMLAAALDAEDILSVSEGSLSHKGNKNSVVPLMGRNLRLKQCFSSAKSERGVLDSPITQNALAIAADKHKLPASSDLVSIAAHCNERKMASRNVKEASDKLYLWAMLKKKGVSASSYLLNCEYCSSA